MRATPIPAALTDGWQRALESWTERTHHDTVLGVAVQHQELAWLAGKYRDAARSNPSDTIATERMAKLQRAAAIVAFSLPRETAELPARRPYRAAAAMLVAAVLALGVGLRLTEDKVNQQRSPQVSRHP